MEIDPNKEWHDDLPGLVAQIAVQARVGSCWWSQDPDLKYLQIRVDVRDGRYWLGDRQNRRIDPARVWAAIKKHNERMR